MKDFGYRLSKSLILLISTDPAGLDNKKHLFNLVTIYLLFKENTFGLKF